LAVRLKPVVTIGVCVRNCEETVGEVIESILDQDFPFEQLEIIFVDDGSEDGTLSVIQGFVSKTKFNIRVFSCKWSGLGFARQLVVDNAHGEYVIWVDGDMTLSRDYVRTQVELMDNNPHVGIAKGKYGLDHQKSLVATLENVPFAVFSQQNEGRSIEKLPGTGGAICRLEAIKAVRGFDSQIKGAAEDIDLEYRIRNAGWSIYGSPAIFYEKRPETWKHLWTKYFWYGYGMHYVLHKDRDIERLYEMIPPVALLEGFLCSVSAYKLTRKKTMFLLPIHFFFKMTAWLLGFMKSHMDSYGHAKRDAEG
jgi:glycosyltransferase involved in cell wall biosynthesis